MTFDQLKLPAQLLTAVQKLKFSTPTAVQAVAIPAGLEGQDVLASAQTGTGKTLAFCLPAIARLLADPKAKVLVLTPTRELAQQVLTTAESLTRSLGVHIPGALLVGGMPMHKQLKKLKNNARLIVGTPGRIHDHVRRQSLFLPEINVVVLDEIDRMLDMGFRQEVDKVMAGAARDKQCLMFSATLSPELEKLAMRYLKNPKRIEIAPAQRTNPNIRHLTLHLNKQEKFQRLFNLVSRSQMAMIVFVNTKRQAKKLAEQLSANMRDVDALHGDMPQSRRNRVMQSFRDGRVRILVATDVAARGLDVSDIGYVVNYDLPMSHEDYVHRTGRTGRAGSRGEALTFLMPEDKSKWRRYSTALKLQTHSYQPLAA